MVGACSSCAGRTTVHFRPKGSASCLAFLEGAVSGKRLPASVAELICIRAMGSARPLKWYTPRWWSWICRALGGSEEGRAQYEGQSKARSKQSGHLGLEKHSRGSWW